MRRPRFHPTTIIFRTFLYCNGTMSHEESISLEETNKIRISLGLKPLTDDNAPTDNKEKQAEDNYAKQRQQEAQDREKR